MPKRLVPIQRVTLAPLVGGLLPLAVEVVLKKKDAPVNQRLGQKKNGHPLRPPSFAR